MSEDVTSWLQELGLGKYAAAFAENDVDFRALPSLSESDLIALGVSLGHRRILQQAITALSEGRDAPGAETSPNSTHSASDASRSAWERHPDERKRSLPCALQHNPDTALFRAVREVGN